MRTPLLALLAGLSNIVIRDNQAEAQTPDTSSSSSRRILRSSSGYPPSGPCILLLRRSNGSTLSFSPSTWGRALQPTRRGPEPCPWTQRCLFSSKPLHTHLQNCPSTTMKILANNYKNLSINIMNRTITWTYYYIRGPTITEIMQLLGVFT